MCSFRHLFFNWPLPRASCFCRLFVAVRWVVQVDVRHKTYYQDSWSTDLGWSRSWRRSWHCRKLVACRPVVAHLQRNRGSLEPFVSCIVSPCHCLTPLRVSPFLALCTIFVKNEMRDSRDNVLLAKTFDVQTIPFRNVFDTSDDLKFENFYVLIKICFFEIDHY